MINDIENYYLDFETHCHTNMSDGKSTVKQIIEQAIHVGLSKIAITDHGPLHTMDGVKYGELDAYLKMIGDAKKEYKNDIEILKGLEFNLVGLDGTCDIPKDYEQEFDWRVLGIHKCAKYKNFKSACVLSYSSFIKCLYNNSYIIKNATSAYVNAVNHYNIDMISHIGYSANVDIVEVANACEQNGTFIELNEKHMEITRGQAHDMISKTKANFILGTDSHIFHDIGKNTRGIEFVVSNDIPLNRVYNLSKKIN